MGMLDNLAEAHEALFAAVFIQLSPSSLGRVGKGMMVFLDVGAHMGQSLRAARSPAFVFRSHRMFRAIAAVLARA